MVAAFVLAGCAPAPPGERSPAALQGPRDASGGTPMSASALAAAATAPGSSAATPSTTTPAPAAAATGASAAAPVRPPPRPLAISLAEARRADASVPLARDALTIIDTRAEFHVSTAQPIVDGRLALLDEQEAAIPSVGTVEIGGQSRFTLVPKAPLVPGTAYTLRLDGAASRDLHDASGAAYSPLSLRLKSAGEKPPPPPKKRVRSRRRR